MPTGTSIEGFWQEWTPDDPTPNTGYDAELWLPPGLYIVNAAASVHLAPDATGPSEVECSLFVGQDNRSVNQVVVAPGNGQSIAATCHVDSPADGIVVQWVCGGTTGPFRLISAVTAIRVTELHHVASTWWPTYPD